MTTTDQAVRVTVNAERLLRAWRAVACAASADPAYPGMCGVTYVEAFDSGLRLSATDKYMALYAWVPRDPSAPAPALADEPKDAATVSDVAGLVPAAVAEPWPSDSVTLEFADDSMSLVLARGGLLRLAPPATSFPLLWRPHITGFAGTRTRSIHLNPELLVRLAKAAAVFGGDHRNPIHCEFSGQLGPVLVEIRHSDPAVAGVLMPVRPAGSPA